MLKSSLTEIRRELSTLSQKDLVELSIRLIKFKKDNKELMDYCLFEKQDEKAYIQQIKEEIEAHFAANTFHSLYHFKKSVRKTLRLVEKYAKYSGNTITQVELLLYFCQQSNEIYPNWYAYEALQKITVSLIKKMEKSILKLHEDLQFDYSSQLEKIKENIN